jgi:hypothetical protein
VATPWWIADAGTLDAAIAGIAIAGTAIAGSVGAALFWLSLVPVA